MYDMSIPPDSEPRAVDVPSDPLLWAWQHVTPARWSPVLVAAGFHHLLFVPEASIHLPLGHTPPLTGTDRRQGYKGKWEGKRERRERTRKTESGDVKKSREGKRKGQSSMGFLCAFTRFLAELKHPLFLGTAFSFMCFVSSFSTPPGAPSSFSGGCSVLASRVEGSK